MSEAQPILKDDKIINVRIEGSIEYRFDKTIEMTVEQYEEYKDAHTDEIADMFLDSHNHVLNNDPSDIEVELELLKKPSCVECWDIKECQTCCGSGTILNPKYKYIQAGNDRPETLPENTVYIKDVDNNQIECSDCKGSCKCHHCDEIK